MKKDETNRKPKTVHGCYCLNGETVPQNEELIKSENPQTIHVNAQNVLNHIVVTS